MPGQLKTDMSSNVNLPEEDLSCPVCCDIFRDPVLLECSHSFCKNCLQRYWDTSAHRECPVCRRRASKRTPPSNLALKNLSEAFLQGVGQNSMKENKLLCNLHGERLKLFCLSDGQLVCVVCQVSRTHKDHACSPIEEAAQDCKDELKATLKKLQDTLDFLIKLKETSEEMLKHIKNQALATEKQITDQFIKLHQFLYEEEAARLAAVKEEEEEKTGGMKHMMAEVAAGVLSFTETITVITQEMTAAEDMTFLQNFKASMERAQSAEWGPERISGALIDVAKHLSNLNYKVCEKMLLQVQYTPVTLDPNTAHPCLFLSHDLTSLQYTGRPHRLPDNPERFHMSAEVLGRTGINSGRHSWVVETGSNDDWILGAACMTVTKHAEVQARPENGFWTLCLRDGVYRAMSSPPKALAVTGTMQRVTVQLDWDMGQVSFYDSAKDDTPLYTFSHSFTDNVFPYFYTQSRQPLIIMPERVCLTVQRSEAGHSGSVPHK